MGSPDRGHWVSWGSPFLGAAAEDSCLLLAERESISLSSSCSGTTPTHEDPILTPHGLPSGPPPSTWLDFNECILVEYKYT